MSAVGEDDISPAVKYLCIDYPFMADCTLHLEDGTEVRRELRSRWYSRRPLNEAEWQSCAESTLAWIIGTLHEHDRGIPARIERWTVHSWQKRWTVPSWQKQ
jgi:hypothetical protein